MRSPPELGNLPFSREELEELVRFIEGQRRHPPEQENLIFLTHSSTDRVQPQTGKDTHTHTILHGMRLLQQTPELMEECRLAR